MDIAGELFAKFIQFNMDCFEAALQRLIVALSLDVKISCIIHINVAHNMRKNPFRCFQQQVITHKTTHVDNCIKASGCVLRIEMKFFFVEQALKEFFLLLPLEVMLYKSTGEDYSEQADH